MTPKFDHWFDSAEHTDEWLKLMEQGFENNDEKQIENSDDNITETSCTPKQLTEENQIIENFIDEMEKPKDEIKLNYNRTYKPNPEYDRSRAYRTLTERNINAYWSMKEEYQKDKKKNDKTLDCKTIKRKYFLVFMMEACNFGATQWIEAREFLNKYQQWMEKQRKEVRYLRLIPSYQTTGVNRILRKFGFIECKTKQYIYWNGITIREDSPEEYISKRGEEEEERKKIVLEIMPDEIVTITRKKPGTPIDNKMEKLEEEKKILERQRNYLLRAVTLKSMNIPQMKKE